MDLTLSSITTMCILNSILVLVLCLLFRSDKVLGKIGPACVIGELLAIIFRMFVPLEFSYTYSLFVDDILSPIRMVLIYPIIEKPILITIFRLILIVWVAGAVFLMIRKLFQYAGFMRGIRILPTENWDKVAADYEFNLSCYPDLKDVKLVYCKLFSSPYLVGIRNPYIVLPSKDYTNDQFSYIVLHELMHVRNKDIVWKVMIDLLCVAFWWNPVFYFLRKELFNLIEMRNDMQILSELSDEEKIEYMVCLKSTAFSYTKRDMAFGVSFNRGDLKNLARRLKLIVNDNKFNRFQQIVTAVVVAVLLFGTSAVIIEPRSFDLVEESGAIVLDSTNTFLVKNGDIYDVYVYGAYFMTTDDLSPFRNVIIYDSIKDVIEN